MNTNNRGRYDRSPLQILRFKISVTENRIHRNLRKVSEDEEIIRKFKEEEARLIRQDA